MDPGPHLVSGNNPPPKKKHVLEIPELPVVLQHHHSRRKIHRWQHLQLLVVGGKTAGDWEKL